MAFYRALCQRCQLDGRFRPKWHFSRARERGQKCETSQVVKKKGAKKHRKASPAVQSELPPSRFYRFYSCRKYKKMCHSGGNVCTAPGLVGLSASQIQNLFNPRGPLFHVISFQVKGIKVITVIDEFKQREKEANWRVKSELRLQAQNSTCFCILWQPSGNYLISMQEYSTYKKRSEVRGGKGKGALVYWLGAH